MWSFRTPRNGRSPWRQLLAELEVRLPVFSAETTRATEAEFIRARLPRRPLLRVLALVALGVAVMLAWSWLT